MAAALKPSIVIIGAGPYGLSAAAHTRSAGFETRVFGRPMEFWQKHMPAGMLLRSSWEASRISDARRALTLEAYEDASSIRLPRRIPLPDFMEYGRWFQRHSVPDVDERRVTRVEPAPRGFRVVAEDGEHVFADRVVVATGLDRFAWRPPEFDGLPAALASHSYDHGDLAEFRGRQVVVVGAGQSAVESAVLLHENGAHVELLGRAPRLRWLRRSAWLHSRSGALQRLLYPPTDVGPPGLSLLVAQPDLFRLLPATLQRSIANRCIRPAASGWLLPRASGVRFTLGRRVVSATAAHGRLRLDMDDGTSRHVDHALLATGYRIDVSRYQFLSEELIRQVRSRQGYPDLRAGFEASVPGLHFLGAAAALSFGPILRFVCGTWYASRMLTQALVTRSETGAANASVLSRADPAT